MISARPNFASEAEGVDPKEAQNYFVKHGRYTAGTQTRYRPSIITAEPAWQQRLTEGLVIGMRFIPHR